jgi:hypothetical protein
MFRVGQRLNAVLRIQREGMEKAVYPRVGVAFVNATKEKEKPYITVRLDALPVGGEIHLYPHEPKDAQKADHGAGAEEVDRET